MPGRIGQKKGSVSRAVKSPTGLGQPDLEPVAARARGRPRWTFASPSMTAAAPTISRMKLVAGDSSRGFATRLKASAKLRAVTGRPRVEAERSLQLEVVRPAVLGDRESPHHLRNHACARSPRCVRIVEELGAGREPERPRIGVVGEGGIDGVEIRRQTEPQRSALRRLGAPRRPGDARGNEQSRTDGQHGDRERAPASHLLSCRRPRGRRRRRGCRRSSRSSARRTAVLQRGRSAPRAGRCASGRRRGRPRPCGGPRRSSDSPPPSWRSPTASSSRSSSRCPQPVSRDPEAARRTPAGSG